jgi:predicted metal-dependent hydrolase
MQTAEHYELSFRRGMEMFNSRRFFDAHEVWEEIWLASPEPRRTFLQGVIQIAAAYHHYLRGNRDGACSLLNAGLRRLGAFPARYHDIELDALRVAARQWCDILTQGSDPGAEALPQISRSVISPVTKASE